MAPWPVISARVNVLPGSIIMKGLIFQPCPRSRAASEALPCVAMPPLPFSPVRFSGLIEKVFARDTLYKLLRLLSRPSYELSWAEAAKGAHNIRLRTKKFFTRMTDLFSFQLIPFVLHFIRMRLKILLTL